MVYNKFSDYLKSRYSARVYKLPVSIPVSCPNRDGRLSGSGCIFCGSEGAGFESLPQSLSVKEQLLRNAEYMGKNYKAEKFIAYFQNYSNTYIPLESFGKYMREACLDGVAAIYISTRPDCINDAWLAFLKELKTEKHIDIVIELGLQSVNCKTLRSLARGHGLAEFIDAVLRIKRFGLETCAHMINDLPMDSLEDVVEGSRILSALGVDQVKCHSLYILKDTVLGEMYEHGELIPLSMEEFISRTIAFLENLSPEIVVQRLIGRAPEERSLFCSWNTSWRKIQDEIEMRMHRDGSFQGRLFNYMNGGRCMIHQ
jgi:uncharacterized protein